MDTTGGKPTTARLIGTDMHVEVIVRTPVWALVRFGDRGTAWISSGKLSSPGDSARLLRLIHA